MLFISLYSAAYSALVRARGGGGRNCDGLRRTHGVMEANCGPAPVAFPKGVGRQTPTAVGDPTIPRTPTNGGGGGANPSVIRHAQMLSATLCPQAIPACIDLA